MSKRNRNIVIDRINELASKANDRLVALEQAGAIDESTPAGLIMADITAELAEGYSDVAKGQAFQALRRVRG